jgi:excisionase family DNA binding protein
MKELPGLPELLVGLEQAFEHHLELERRGRGTALLRMAGREFRVAQVNESPDALAQHICRRLSEVAAYGLATVLTDESAAGTRLRMDFIATLAHIEATQGPSKERHAKDGEVVLTTAEAAARLGMSRPYVSMLCDQGKLGEVRRSEGGHRRIRLSALDEYRKVLSPEAATAASKKEH